MPSVVIDTNILLRMLLPSQRDAVALALWEHLAHLGVDVVIPSQAVSEAMSKIRNEVSRDRLSETDGDRYFGELRALVASTQVETAQLGAWEVAKLFDRPTTYDSEFYALAERLGAQFWTADDRFVNAMGTQRPTWVKRLEEFSAAST